LSPMAHGITYTLNPLKYRVNILDAKTSHYYGTYQGTTLRLIELHR
jgi:hypothetical protein